MSNYFDDDRNRDPFGNFRNPPETENHADWYKRILVMAIVSLLFVLALVLALHLYVRFVLRRLAIQQLSLTVAESSTDPPNNGLHPSVIAALPIVVFKPQSPSSIEECAVCLSAMEEGEVVRVLPNCKHNFHVSCIDTWLESHATCPICRTKAEPIIRLIEPQPREGPVVGSASAPPAPVEANVGSPKTVSGNSVPRLSSFRRILSRERSSMRIQPDDEIDVELRDLERQ